MDYSNIYEDGFEKLSADLLESVDFHSPIKDYVRDKTVFITGGFGFVGKLLIEKLLRCDVKKIFLLVRAKKGKSLAERFEKLMSDAVSRRMGIIKINHCHESSVRFSLNF